MAKIIRINLKIGLITRIYRDTATQSSHFVQLFDTKISP
jgi:hypothetical protein